MPIRRFTSSACAALGAFPALGWRFYPAEARLPNDVQRRTIRNVMPRGKGVEGRQSVAPRQRRTRRRRLSRDALFLSWEARIPPKRRLWRMKRGENRRSAPLVTTEGSEKRLAQRCKTVLSFSRPKRKESVSETVPCRPQAACGAKSPQKEAASMSFSICVCSSAMESNFRSPRR